MIAIRGTERCVLFLRFGALVGVLCQPLLLRPLIERLAVSKAGVWGQGLGLGRLRKGLGVVLGFGLQLRASHSSCVRS